MASMKDAGVGSGGNFISPSAVFGAGARFNIVGAVYRAAHDDYKDQIDVSILFYEPFTVVGRDAEGKRTERDINADEVYQMSLGLNPVRQRLIDWFSNHPDEPLTGVDREDGLVLAYGKSTGKGNPPYIFVDPPTTETNVPF